MCKNLTILYLCPTHYIFLIHLSLNQYVLIIISIIIIIAQAYKIGLFPSDIQLQRSLGPVGKYLALRLCKPIDAELSNDAEQIGCCLNDAYSAVIRLSGTFWTRNSFCAAL